MEYILIVDDDKLLLQALGDTLRDEGYAVVCASGWEEAERAVREKAFDLFLLDYNMPEVDGIELMKRLRRTIPTAEAMIITGYGTIERGVEAIREGARDYVTKPIESYELLYRIKTILERRRLRLSLRQKDEELKGKYGKDRIVGVSRAVQEIRELCCRAGRVGSNVLIQGESGTGKELVAKAIHYASSRSEGPFLAVNCGAIAANLAEREFFGHEKHAFTGAGSGGTGYFEAATGGTLFLDEIGDMTSDLQVKLLRVLDNQEVTRVGATQPVPIDVRVLFATNRNLEEMSASGEFRRDLFYRINVIRIELPPLRERREDIPLLTAEFIARCANRLGVGAKTISEEAMMVLEDYDWPGNARELENVIERAMALSRTDRLELEDIPDYVFREPLPAGSAAQEAARDFMSARRQAQERFDREFIVRSLARNCGNVSKTADEIGLARSVLQRFMRKYDLRRDGNA